MKILDTATHRITFTAEELVALIQRAVPGFGRPEDASRPSFRVLDGGTEIEVSWDELREMLNDGD